MPELLFKTFTEADHIMHDRQQISAGCTAVVSFLKVDHREARAKRTLYTANVGDARAVLCRNGKAVRLSYDHKGSDKAEIRRIISLGGFIMHSRVNGVLAVTRSLGDAAMKEFISGSPYTTETELYGADVDSLLILACDGLWDVCSDQEAVDLIKANSDPQSCAQELLRVALEKGSTDNISVLVVRFD